jgi:hypothetical protein
MVPSLKRHGGLVLGILLLAQTPSVAQEIEHYVIDTFPDAIQARHEQRDRSILALRRPDDDQSFRPELVVTIAQKWKPGQTITVAFKGGTSDLHKDIARVASEWMQHANLKLDFGLDSATGKYRTWATSDTTYKADVRISFDDDGYWSVVGTDSRDPSIVGTGEASMNFEKFDQGAPNGWEGTVRHEFGHALAAQHEHQHPTQGCDAEWRWDDDPGYVPTKDSFGQFIADKSGRRPGIYTVLGGPPNKWPKSKVDHNLRQLKDTKAYDFGDFDVKSVMKYYLAAWMFKNGTKSQCYNGTRNDDLSAEDKTRIAINYPKENDLVAEVIRQRAAVMSRFTALAAGVPAFQTKVQTHLDVFR